VDLTSDHLLLLRAVADLQDGDRNAAVGTDAVGERLVKLFKERGGSYTWYDKDAWHGTHPWAEELRSAGLLKVDVGMAEFRAPGQPATTADEYYLFLTDLGWQHLQG
jgi:hypothetical protein